MVLGWEGSGTHCSEVSGGTGERGCVQVTSYLSCATMSRGLLPVCGGSQMHFITLSP